MHINCRNINGQTMIVNMIIVLLELIKISIKPEILPPTPLKLNPLPPTIHFIQPIDKAPWRGYCC